MTLFKLHIKSTLIFIGAIFFSFDSFGVILIKDKNFSNKAQELLMKDMSEFTKVLSRDIYVYHWAPLEKMKINPTHKTYPLKYHKAKKHLKKRLSMFKKHYKTRERAVGNGLYAATDPASSAWYGGERHTPWGMVEILIPKGSKFLDLRLGYDKILLKESTYLYLRDRCHLYNYEFGNFTIDNKKYVGVHKIALTYKKLCRKALIKAVQSLNINFFTYLWVDNHTYKGLCDRRDGPYDHQGSSILIVNMKVQKSYYNFFSEGISNIKDDSFQFYKYKELHDKMKLARPWLGERDHAVWPFFDQFEKTRGLEEKLKKTTFTCMKKYKEDQIER